MGGRESPLSTNLGAAGASLWMSGLLWVCSVSTRRGCECDTGSTKQKGSWAGALRAL